MYFGSMKASKLISANRTPSEKAANKSSQQPLGRDETLRCRCFLEAERHRLASEHGLCGILVPYSDESISREAGVPGRATPGCNASGLAVLEKHSDSWPAWKAMLARGMTEWEATRSLHSGPKFFKELARGDEAVLDADRQKSFPNAVRDRHPDLRAVDQWVSNPMACVVLCGLEANNTNLKLVKSFCNSAGGSGIAFEREWLQAAGVTVLPDWLQAYRQDLRTAAERDTTSKPVLAEVFKSLLVMMPARSRTKCITYATPMRNDWTATWPTMVGAMLVTSCAASHVRAMATPAWSMGALPARPGC